MSLRLSDKTISAIAQLVQVAMLTGTDVVDNLRSLRLESDGEFLNPDSTFVENFQKSIDDLISAAESTN